MEYMQKLQKALQELNHITGITLDIKADTPEEAEQALTQIKCLCTAYREKYNSTDFLQNLMTGVLPAYDIDSRASRLHISTGDRRVLFLLEIKSMNDTVMEILKNLFPSQTKTYLIPVSVNVVGILYPIAPDESEETIRYTAYAVADTLTTEALALVHLSYSGIMDSLSELPNVFQETSLALKIGKIFYSEQTVFPYNELGVGRLIYQLPVSLCQSFLKEIFGSKIPDSFDTETSVAINRFFQNNLNIAETSRQLHMHRNTLIYRLDQIQKRTGLDLRLFEDAMTFKIALMIINYLHSERNL